MRWACAHDRLMQKTRVDSDGCWEWMGHINCNGYGVIIGTTNVGRVRTAHRLSYYVFIGDLEKGKVIAHSCDNRKCVNPSHLWQGTQQENLRDMVNKGRENPHKRGVAHCPHGHPYDDENTFYRNNGWRDCRECRRQRTRQWRKTNVKKISHNK